MSVLAEVLVPDKAIDALKYGSLGVAALIAVVIVVIGINAGATLTTQGVVLGVVGILSMLAVAIVVQVTPKPKDPQGEAENTLETVCDLVNTKLILADKDDPNALAIAEQIRKSVARVVTCPRPKKH